MPEPMIAISALALALATTCEAPDGGSPLSGCEPETPIVEAPPPTRVFLGVDCSKSFTVSLPDDAFTECESE